MSLDAHDYLSSKRSIFDIPKEEPVTNESVLVEVLRCKREKAQKTGSLEDLESAFEYLKKIVDGGDLGFSYKVYEQLYYIFEDYAVKLYQRDDCKRSARLLGFSLLLQLDYLSQNAAKDDWKNYSSIEEIISSLADDFFIDTISKNIVFKDELLELAKDQRIYNAFGSVLVSLKAVYMEIDPHRKLPFEITWNKHTEGYHFKERILADEMDLEMSHDSYDQKEETSIQAET
ncbi:MAG: hypothetical protein ACSNEK_01905 [Parachlamydiaceae bacterium]